MVRITIRRVEAANIAITPLCGGGGGGGGGVR